MNKTTLLATTLALFAGACASHQYTAHDPSAVYPPRAATDVAISSNLPADAYREAGVVEVVADSYADARTHFQTVGAEHGCHAVRPFTTRTSVFGGPNWTGSQTIYLGSCLVPE